MDERDIRNLIDDVKRGRLSRRAFVQTMVLTDIATGAVLLAGLGALSATEAAAVADSAGSAVRTTVKG